MKPSPPPHVPGKTDAERFDNAVRKVLSAVKVETRPPQEKTKKK